MKLRVSGPSRSRNDWWYVVKGHAETYVRYGASSGTVSLTCDRCRSTNTDCAHVQAVLDHIRRGGE